MVDEQDAESLSVGIGADVEAVQIECPVAADALEFGRAEPFDSIFDLPRTARIEYRNAIEQPPAAGVEEIDAMRLRQLLNP